MITRNAYPYYQQPMENTSQTIVAHAAETCRGDHCPIHKRSQHSMRAFPQHWRDDVKLMERICPHGIGHPDPDDPEFGAYVHGCDGCCSK